MMHLSVVGDVDLVQQLLLVAGDVETNPGPIPPGTCVCVCVWLAMSELIIRHS